MTVSEGGVQECTRGSERDSLGPFERRESPIPRPSDAWIWHGGVIAGDLDGDGWLDLVVALEQGLELYQGTATGEFVARGTEVFGGFDLSFASGGVAADYDGDGDLDLYVTRIAGQPAPEGGTFGVNRLLNNRGNGTFDDVTDVAGVSGCGEDFRDGQTKCFKSMASSFGDYDEDGDLDLYVGDYGYVDETPGTKQEDMGPAERDFLYRNEGDGTFSDVSDLIPGEFHDGYTYAGGFHDFDADGFLDLYTVNDFGNLWPNRVLWGNGDGTFRYSGGVPGTDPSHLDASMTGMGLGVGDLNGDGWLDVAVAEWKKNTLFESRPDLGLWIDVADSKGFVNVPADNQWVGWGTVLGDLNDDGYLDIVNQYGHVSNENPLWDSPLYQPDGLYLNDGTDAYTFSDVALDWGVADMGMSRGAVLADLNRDGYLDLAKRSLDAKSTVYLSRCGDAGWLEVALEQPGTMNQDAVGGRVFVTAGGRTQLQVVVAGGVSYASSPAPEVHFGLGDARTVDEIRVEWPDGAESVLGGVDARQRITISRSPAP
ncbi:MAG: CRTAC1 family protein [Myxococcota bacterium]